MTLRQIALPWSGQPQEAAQLSREWVDRGLQSVWLPGVLLLPGGCRVAGGGTATVGPFGSGTVFNGTNQSIALGRDALSHGRGARIAWTRIGSASGSRNISAGGNAGTGFRVNGTTVEIVNTGASVDLAATSAVSAGETCVLGMSAEPFNLRLYKNGVLLTSRIDRGTGNASNNLDTLGQTGTGSQYLDGAVFMHVSFSGRLSDEDQSALAQDPWQLFEPLSIWVPVSGGSSAPDPIQPPLLTNSQALHVPSVGRGAVALSAPLLSSVGVLYAASVGRGSVALSAPLLANTATLYDPTVTSVSAALRPPLLANTNTTYVPEVARGSVSLAAPLLANLSELLAPAVGSGSATISPPLLVSGSVVHAPSVQAGAVALSAPLLASAVEVYAPSVSAGAVQVLPPLLASTQIFYAPSVTGGAAAIRPGLLANTSDLYAPFVTAGDITLMPPLLVGSQIFFPPTVGDGALPIIDSAFLRYVVPGKSLAFSVPGQSLTY